jgi:hypothetical protein
MRDKDGLPIGTANDNPILDTHRRKVESQDGHRASMAANATAENLFSQIDDRGTDMFFFVEIADHCTNGEQVM